MAAAALVLCCAVEALAVNDPIVVFKRNAKVRSAVLSDGVDGGPPEVVPPPRVHVHRMTEVASTFFGGHSVFTSLEQAMGGYSLTPNAHLFAAAVPIRHPVTGVISNVWYWDGMDDTAPPDGTNPFQGGNGGVGTVPVDERFQLPPSSTRVRVAKFSFLFNELQGDNRVVEFFRNGPSTPGNERVPLATTNDFGAMHQGIALSVRGDNQLAVPPPDGFYLIAMRMEMANLARSKPILMLLNAKYERGPNGIIMDNDAPRFDAASEAMAVEWVENMVVPSPGGLPVLMVIGVGYVLRRGPGPSARR